MQTSGVFFYSRIMGAVTPAVLYRLALLVLVFLAACVTRVVAQPMDQSEQKHPDVVAVEVRHRGSDRFDFDVTVSSPYDTPQRYADAFRVTGKDGQIYGERRLLHDHANEQPFTRDLYGVRIPGSVRTVQIQAHDQKYGYGGKVVEVTLPGR